MYFLHFTKTTSFNSFRESLFHTQINFMLNYSIKKFTLDKFELLRENHQRKRNQRDF